MPLLSWRSPQPESLLLISLLLLHLWRSPHNQKPGFSFSAENKLYLKTKKPGFSIGMRSLLSPHSKYYSMKELNQSSKTVKNEELYDLLERRKQRPGMYLGQPSVTRLNMLLTGYSSSANRTRFSPDKTRRKGWWFSRLDTGKI